MHIILEGPDGAGKTTLANYLASKLKVTVIPGEGPEKHPGEVIQRLNRNYEKMRQSNRTVLFDRHSVVSHPIYSSAAVASGRKGYHTVIPQTMIDEWHKDAICIYCRAPSDVLEAHDEREGIDTPEHVATITSQHKYICGQYDLWALKYADFIYRRGRTGMVDIALYLATRGL